METSHKNVAPLNEKRSLSLNKIHEFMACTIPSILSTSAGAGFCLNISALRGANHYL